MELIPIKWAEIISFLPEAKSNNYDCQFANPEAKKCLNHVGKTLDSEGQLIKLFQQLVWHIEVERMRLCAMLELRTARADSCGWASITLSPKITITDCKTFFLFSFFRGVNLIAWCIIELTRGHRKVRVVVAHLCKVLTLTSETGVQIVWSSGHHVVLENTFKFSQVEYLQHY